MRRLSDVLTLRRMASSKGPEGPEEGARLASLRTKLNIDRTQIHRETGITPTTQRNLEKDGKGYRLPAYRRFLEALALAAYGADNPDSQDTAVSELAMQLADTATSDSDVFRRFRALYKRASDAQRTAAAIELWEAFDALKSHVDDHDLLMELAVAKAVSQLTKALGNERTD